MPAEPTVLGRVQRVTSQPGYTEDLLAQTAPGAAVYSAAYTVPVGFVGSVTSIFVCNTGAGATTFRIHASKTGAAAAVGNALYYDAAIAGNTTLLVVAPTINGWACPAGAIWYFGSAAGGVTSTIFGYERGVG